MNDQDIGPSQLNFAQLFIVSYALHSYLGTFSIAAKDSKFQTHVLSSRGNVLA